MRELLESAPDAMVVVGGDGRIALVNAQVEALFGWARDELYGRPVEVLLPDHLRAVHAGLRAGYVADPHTRSMGAGLELLARHRNGSDFPVDVSLSPLHTEAGTLVVAAVRDITERRRVEAALAAKMAELASVASTDPLTGLANRRGLERSLSVPMTGGFAVLAIDVDHLKDINDTYGHEAGDAHLRAVATTLRLSVREEDVVARVGGDEFAALLPGRTLTEAVMVGERLRRAMYGVVVPHGFARVSVGCARGGARDNALNVWSLADEALYRAKARGRDRVESATTPSLALVGSSLPHWERTIPRLLAGHAMNAVYQPIVRMRDGSILGYEALCRRRDADSQAGVDGLFAAAKRLGMHRDLDWMARRAAVDNARKLRGGASLFINVGASSLLDPLHAVDQMLLLLRWGGLAPARVVLEITERETIHDLDRLREVLDDYRRHGFRFALDDVGEGHSTFAVLAAAAPEFVKVSGTLTGRARERGPAALIRALVAFAQATDTQLVAEHMETHDDVQRLCELGVTIGQGYALGRPEPLDRRRERAAPPR
jgi:diguanylate cyclase (GGDEF)-like protein/PAS domain S-box-containing protein